MDVLVEKDIEISVGDSSKMINWNSTLCSSILGISDDKCLPQIPVYLSHIQQACALFSFH